MFPVYQFFLFILKRCYFSNREDIVLTVHCLLGNDWTSVFENNLQVICYNLFWTDTSHKNCIQKNQSKFSCWFFLTLWCESNERSTGSVLQIFSNKSNALVKACLYKDYFFSSLLVYKLAILCFGFVSSLVQGLQVYSKYLRILRFISLWFHGFLSF